MKSLSDRVQAFESGDEYKKMHSVLKTRFSEKDLQSSFISASGENTVSFKSEQPITRAQAISILADVIAPPFFASKTFCINYLAIYHNSYRCT